MVTLGIRTRDLLAAAAAVNVLIITEGYFFALSQITGGSDIDVVLHNFVSGDARIRFL